VCCVQCSIIKQTVFASLARLLSLLHSKMPSICFRHHSKRCISIPIPPFHDPLLRPSCWTLYNAVWRTLYEIHGDVQQIVRLGQMQARNTTADKYTDTMFSKTLLIRFYVVSNSKRLLRLSFKLNQWIHTVSQRTSRAHL
jgi:hypothetical protein